MSIVILRFRNWLSMLDQDKLVALADIKGWSIVLIFSLIGILIGSLGPVTSGFFQTEFQVPFIVWLVVCAGAILEISDRVRKGLSFVTYGLMRMFVATILQFFLWTMVVYSSVMGGAVIVAFAILVASYHGQFYQISLEYPFGVFITLIALAGAFLLDADFSHLAILILGGLMALGTGWVMGSHERQRMISVREKDALRAAVDAQILYEQTQEVEHVQSAMQEIRGTNHDAGNVLSSILMNLQFLTTRLSDIPDDVKPAGDVLEISGDLGQSVSRLRQLIERGRDIGGEAARRESVPLAKVLNAVVRDHRLLFPKIKFKQKSCDTGGVKFDLPGGEQTLHRILTNIIRNACEGEGLNSATWIEISVFRDGDNDWVTIRVRDNGPGFTEEQLSTAISHFQTTKSTGTGLGLYTTHRLVAASKGQLVLSNHEQGGAEVRIVLPLPELVAA